MASGRDATKRERIEVFLGRLDAAPVASDADEAYRQVCDILNAVEDELTNIPFDPTRWMTDGRMYPPQRDNARVVPGSSGVTRYRSAGHNTFIGANGAIEIRSIAGHVLLSKPGADGGTIESRREDRP